MIFDTLVSLKSSKQRSFILRLQSPIIDGEARAEIEHEEAENYGDESFNDEDPIDVSFHHLVEDIVGNCTISNQLGQHNRQSPQWHMPTIH